MTPSWFFASGLGCSVTISILVVLYLRRPLENLRAELCGNQNRAEFWTAFSVVTIGVVPLIFALGYQPTLTAGVPPLLEIAQQLRTVAARTRPCGRSVLDASGFTWP